MLIFVQYLFLEALIVEAKSAFDKIDQDKNGEISVQELGTALRLLGLSPTREEVQTMMIGIDKKGAFGNEIKRVNSKGRIICWNVYCKYYFLIGFGLTQLCPYKASGKFY